MKVAVIEQAPHLQQVIKHDLEVKSNMAIVAPISSRLPHNRYDAYIIGLYSSNFLEAAPLLKRVSGKAISICIMHFRDQPKRMWLLQQGVHECLEYPFHLSELAYRLANLHRLRKDKQVTEGREQPSRYEISKSAYLEDSNQMLVNEHLGVYLNYAEWRILQAMLKHKNNLLSYEQLGNALNTKGECTRSRNLITSYVYRIKKKADLVQLKLPIRSVYGYGYYLDERHGPV